MLSKSLEPTLQRVARRGAFVALAIGTALLHPPLSANADELGRQAAQAGNIRGLEKNITNAEAVRLPIEAPAPTTISAPQVNVREIAPTANALVEIGDSR